MRVKRQKRQVRLAECACLGRGGDALADVCDLPDLACPAIHFDQPPLDESDSLQQEGRVFIRWGAAGTRQRGCVGSRVQTGARVVATAVPGAGRGAVCTSRLEQIFKSTSRFCTQTSPSSSPPAPSFGLALATPDERAGCTCLDPPPALLFSLPSPGPRVICFLPPPLPPSSERPLARPRAELRASTGWPTELPSDMKGGFETSTTGSHDGGLDCEDGRKFAHARQMGLAILRACSMLARVVPGGPLRSGSTGLSSLSESLTIKSTEI